MKYGGLATWNTVTVPAAQAGAILRLNRPTQLHRAMSRAARGGRTRERFMLLPRFLSSHARPGFWQNRWEAVSQKYGLLLLLLLLLRESWRLSASLYPYGEELHLCSNSKPRLCFTQHSVWCHTVMPRPH